MGKIELTQFDNVLKYVSSNSNMSRSSTRARNSNRRLSLAYGHLNEIPQEILSQIANQIQFLDLSHNEFKNLSFLSEFTELQTLVLDRNLNLDCSTLPLLKKLEVLWLNNCNLINIGDWLQQLQLQCPNLRQLSMMCNPVGQTELNGVTDDEENAYRKEVIQVLPQLSYFDGVSVAEIQRCSSAQSTLSLMLLDDVLRRKLRSFIDLPTRLQRSFKSMDKLNGSLLMRTMSFSAKQAVSR